MTRVHLAQESSLHHLDLSHNPLHHLAPAALSGLAQLRSLQLIGTQLASCPGPALAPLRSLQQLDLSSTQLQQLGAGELQLPQLGRLTVTGCPQLARLGPGVFLDTPRLQHLNISHNPGTGEMDRVVVLRDQYKGRVTSLESDHFVFL